MKKEIKNHEEQETPVLFFSFLCFVCWVGITSLFEDVFDSTKKSFKNFKRTIQWDCDEQEKKFLYFSEHISGHSFDPTKHESEVLSTDCNFRYDLVSDVWEMKRSYQHDWEIIDSKEKIIQLTMKFLKK